MGSNYNYYRVFGCFSRKFKISELRAPPEVRAAFVKYTGGGDHMTADQLRAFLAEYQGEEGCTAADAEAIMAKVLHRRHHVGSRLTLDDFFDFLLQDDLNAPINSQVHHDMSAPIQHYFIYTGHNSYLVGNQLNSECSEIPIIKALENGVRGIELDLWPNSTKDNIHVLHGRTLTPPVPLMKCLESIRKHAFVKSPYPVIITIEDHLTPQLQAKAAEMATQVFGDMLHIPESESIDEFPSPHDLMHKIILSTKPPKEHLSSNTIKDGDTSSSLQEKDSSEGEDFLKEKLNPVNEDKSDEDDEECDVYKKSGSMTAALEYKRLITIRAGNAKKGLRRALINGSDKVSRLSLNEQRLERAAELYATHVIRFTQNNILRVFPKNTRVTSSNFRPMTGWMHGAQMVAFNMQGYGKSLWMMHGLFRTNGGCGYVKKPDLLMNKGPNEEVFDPKLTLPVKTTLKVTVYMGDGWRLDFSHTHFDTYSPPDFYTKVYIVGVGEDGVKKKTRVNEDDWTPYWDEEFTTRKSPNSDGKFRSRTRYFRSYSRTATELRRKAAVAVGLVAVSNGDGKSVAEKQRRKWRRKICPSQNCYRNTVRCRTATEVMSVAKRLRKIRCHTTTD